MQIRRSSERGHANHGWLDSYHTFSFADYYDPKHMGFRSLRVINEDRVEAGMGFGTHGHRDMEIVSYVLEGELAHKDSMGNGSVIRPGDVQRMSAGTGVQHSENNPAKTTTHFLQIWIVPDKPGHTPSYEQKTFSRDERKSRLRLVASPDGRDGSVTIHQDAKMLAGLLAPGDKTTYELPKSRHAWVHVARGKVRVDGTELSHGDAAAIDDGHTIELVSVDDAEVILFDLA